MLIKPFEKKRGKKKKSSLSNYEHFAPKKHWSSNLQSGSWAARLRVASLGKTTVTITTAICTASVIHSYSAHFHLLNRKIGGKLRRIYWGIPAVSSVWCRSSINDVRTLQDRKKFAMKRLEQGPATHPCKSFHLATARCRWGWTTPGSAMLVPGPTEIFF